MPEVNLIQELIDVWPIVAGVGGLLYWFLMQFNQIKENDIKLHSENLIKINDVLHNLSQGQDLMRHHIKQVDQMMGEVEKLQDSIHRDNLMQSEKFTRIDDKVTQLQADAVRQLSDSLIHLQTIQAEVLRGKR